MKKDIIEFVNSLDCVTHSKVLPTMEEIKAAEEKLGVKFADDYVKCLLNYGKLSVGSTELMGISYCDTSSQRSINEYQNTDVVYQTLLLKDLECHAHIPKNMYVIDDLDIDMCLIWQDETGAVYSTMPWSGPQKEADSLVDYLEMCYEEYNLYMSEDWDDDDDE